MLAAMPPPTRAGRILICCPADEEHSFVPLLLSLLLRRRGWDTVYLGANVPLTDLEITVAATHPQLVLLTAQQLFTAAALLDVGNMLLRAQVPLAFGGLIFNRVPALQRVIPGYFLGGRIDSAIAEVEEIMLAPRIRAAAIAPDSLHRDTLAHFTARRAEIEGVVWQHLRTIAVPTRMLAAANLHFGRNIEAALGLGSMEYLTIDLAWIEGLLVNHVGMTPEYLQEYLEIYQQATVKVLGGQANPLVLWLAALADGAIGEPRPRQFAHRGPQHLAHSRFVGDQPENA